MRSGERNDFESLNKLCVSEQYVTHCLGMAFSLDFLPSLELYLVKYVLLQRRLPSGQQGVRSGSAAGSGDQTGCA